MDDPKWIFDPGKMKGDVCNYKKKKKTGESKKKENP